MQPENLTLQIFHHQQWHDAAELSFDADFVCTHLDYLNDYAFCQDENGDTHTHLINPRTLQPVHNSIASLSVIARTSMEADGLATGLTTLGAADALALARQEHLAVCIIERRDGALHTAYTDEFAAFIQPK